MHLRSTHLQCHLLCNETVMLRMMMHLRNSWLFLSKIWSSVGYDRLNLVRSNHHLLVKPGKVKGCKGT